MNDIKNIKHIIKFYPQHLEKLSLLLGIYYLCKSTQTTSLSNFINQYNINTLYFKTTIDALCQDSGFDDLVTGKLYELLLDIQMLN